VLTAYDEARDALTLAALLHRSAPVIVAADLLVYRVLLRDRAAIADLILTTLGALADTRGGASVLLTTLDVYLAAGGNTAEAARRLHLSVRAVTYRLARIRDSTGLDPTDTDVRITLHVAVLGARLLDWPATALPALA
jgi:DNA-binding PucR family transcriptional regulator